MTSLALLLHPGITRTFPSNREEEEEEEEGRGGGQERDHEKINSHRERWMHRGMNCLHWNWLSDSLNLLCVSCMKQVHMKSSAQFPDCPNQTCVCFFFFFFFCVLCFEFVMQLHNLLINSIKPEPLQECLVLKRPFVWLFFFSVRMLNHIILFCWKGLYSYTRTVPNWLWITFGGAVNPKQRTPRHE